ncbi:flagellar basal-body MS-ring/collar protein FliF [Thalassobius sp. Cn5-15]|uniref:flagellar basal-body MS-ring/collar protein FliF n=1 Tax=Thalassobius sp. Cn5-15 TaxID=2917763 RepID=UPI001EF2AD86|nr:flagellar basal-body MS-ring/collar protein FliF [Thalassobius sp. Cn5-15]MCG7492812.1 flagellar M-ring protein FliF [Thalassobius sp. Cn5-15]
MDSTTNPVAPAEGKSPAQQGRAYLEQAQEMMAQPAVRRALPAIILVVVAVFGLVVYMMLAQPKRLSLYTDLPEADKARAVEVLTGGGIDAIIDQSTGALRVTEADYHKARMMLATEGLPAGTPDGISTLNDMPMGASRSVEAARLRRMHELDLARSITEFSNVTSARVHLALPEQTAFIRDTKPPRASVFVQVAPGRALDDGQVSAIVSLVSTSVPGMTRANVSVVDQTGRLLSRESNDPLSALSTQQLGHRKQMETHYRQRIEALLSPIVGAGNVAAEVTVDMDFTRSEITAEQYMPNGSVIRSEQKMTQQNNTQQARGIPGAVSNTPPQETQLVENGPTSFAGGQIENNTENSTRNYEVSRRVETKQPSSAQIVRIHAAVLLRTPAGTMAEDGSLVPGALPESVMKDAEALVRSAIGFQGRRGDTVTLSAQPFIDTFSEVSMPWYKEAWVMDTARYGAQIAVLAIVVLGLVKPIVDRLLFSPAAPASPLGMGAPIGGAPGGLGDVIEVGPGETLAEVRARLDGFEPVGNPWSHVSYEEKLALIRDLTHSDGDRIATAFKSMIEEDSSQLK